MSLVRVDFGEGRLTEETMWQVVVQIPKGGGDYRDIDLMEVVWKVVAMINNLQLTAPITFHDSSMVSRQVSEQVPPTSRELFFIRLRP